MTVGEVDAVVGTAALVGLVTCAVWLFAAAVVSVVAAVPGAVGACAQPIAYAIAPRVVRRLAAMAVGTALGTMVGAGLVAPTAGALAAEPASVGPGVTGPARTLAGRTLVGFPSLDRPATQPPHADQDQPQAPAAPATVVVHDGDCLWAIAAHHLGPGATAAAVAAEWPRWYAANRAAIGPDPDLLRTGSVLLVPPPAATPT